MSRVFIFELYAEKVKLMGNLDIVSAISAFFHLCFIFNMKYPKVKIGCFIVPPYFVQHISGVTDLGRSDAKACLQVWRWQWYLNFLLEINGPREILTIKIYFNSLLISGSRTWKRKDTVINKYEHFCSRVFKLQNWGDLLAFLPKCFL